MSHHSIDNVEDSEVQRLFEALDSLGLDHPESSEEIYKTHLRFSDIEAQVSGLIIKWDVYNSLSRITKLKVNHSNLDAWIEELQMRVFPLWLRRVVTGPPKFGGLCPHLGKLLNQKTDPSIGTTSTRLCLQPFAVRLLNWVLLLTPNGEWTSMS